LLKKILLIVQRSNGDVFLSASLINKLSAQFLNPEIDLLVNDDTFEIANCLPKVNKIITFSYEKKKNERIKQEKEIFKKIFRKYDLSISLTASDRSVIYALAASSYSIAPVEKDLYKSWWKKLLLKKHFFWDSNRHIISNNLYPLKLLNINYKPEIEEPLLNLEDLNKIKLQLANRKITKFIIFHPSAQYNYKIYPVEQRLKLLELLQSTGLKIIVTGGKSKLDKKISKTIPKDKNIFNLIGKTTLSEFICLSHLSECYIGMDTLNMHIASSQNKKVFAIMGPTNLNVWSPWSNISGPVKVNNSPYQVYGNNHIFQAEMPCVPCGAAGCSNLGIKSECLNEIKPEFIFSKVKIQLTL